MAFSNDEITATVEQLVVASISKTYDPLGTRRTDVTFTEIQQAAAGAFLMYPRAPFYCLFLGVQQVLAAIAVESVAIDNLISAVKASGRNVLPINDLTPLFNARAALQELAGAASGRSSPFKDITKAPAFQRYSANTDRFLATAGDAIKQNGDIVDTPQSAKAKLPDLVASLKTSHTDLVLSIAQLSAGIDNYNGLNLPGIVAKSILANATALVGSHADALAALNPNDRLTTLRQTVLDIIAARSVVQEFGSFAGASPTYDITGTGNAYADATHPGTPARATASIAASYNISPARYELDLYLDSVFTPRSLTNVTSMTAAGSLMTFNTAGPVPVDVLVNDYIYVEAGPNIHTRWVVQTLGPTSFTAQGLSAGVNDGARAIEVLAPPATSIPISYSFAAQLQGTISESAYVGGNGFIINDGTLVRPTIYPVPARNNRLIFVIDGVSHTVTLTQSPGGTLLVDCTPRTAAQICTEVNAVINAFGYTASPYLAPRKFYGKVNVAAVSGVTATFTLQGGFGNFGNLGVAIGDVIQPLTGTQQGTWTITGVGPTTLTADYSTTALSQLGVLIEVGPVLRRIQVTALNPENAVQTLSTLGVGDDQSFGTNGAYTLGLPVGATSRSRPSSAKDVAASINASSSLVTAAATFNPLDTFNGHANATSGSLITVQTFIGVGNTAFTPGFLNTLMVTIQGAATAGVQLGDLLVTRGGTYAGATWTITSVSDSLVVAQSAMAGITETGVLVEMGPSLGLSPFDMVRITTGPNQGDYYVSTTPQPTGLDWYLTSAIPLPTDVTTGVAVAFTLQKGSEYMSLASKATNTNSRIMVRGPAATLFFALADEAYDGGVVGSSIYFQLPVKVQGLEPGDLLQFYVTDVNTPDVVTTILAIEGVLLTLDVAVADRPVWSFAPRLNLPFARLHHGHLVDFTTTQTAMDVWLAQGSQQPSFFTELYRRINPLLSNAVPATSEINDVITWLKVLYVQLTSAAFAAYGGTITPLETTLRGYKVNVVTSTDALIRSFREKGADRAIDLLFGGLFQDFFNLTPQTSSYAGHFQNTMQKIVIKDLPVNKSNRSDSHKGKLIGSTETPDPEYNLTDTEGQGVQPDPV